MPSLTVKDLREKWAKRGIINKNKLFDKVSLDEQKEMLSGQKRIATPEMSALGFYICTELPQSVQNAGNKLTLPLYELDEQQMKKLNELFEKIINRKNETEVQKAEANFCNQLLSEIRVKDPEAAPSLPSPGSDGLK